MKLKKKELRQLIESLIFENDELGRKNAGPLSSNFSIDHYYDDSPNKMNPALTKNIYVFIAKDGEYPQRFMTPDGPVFYYNYEIDDQGNINPDYTQGAVSEKDNNVFIYHPENKPAGI
jgi:hypothetical protein